MAGLTDNLAGEILWPFGEAPVFTPAYAATVEVQVANRKTFIKPAQLTGNMALTITASDEQRVGDEIVIVFGTAGTQVLSLAGDVVAPSKTGVAGKNFVYKLEYDGVAFKPVAAAIQID